MDKALFRLLEVDGVLGVLLLSQDGLPVASANIEGEEAETTGALVSAMIATMRSTTHRLSVGDLAAARLTTEEGCLNIQILPELLLMIAHEHQIDQTTLDELLPAVTDQCRALVA